MSSKMQPAEVNQLFIRFQTGDEEAFRKLYDYYFHRLYVIIYAFVGDREEAEDIVVHAFWKLYENRRSLGDAGHVYGFLFVVARNEAVGDLRRKKRQRAADYEQARLAEESYSDPRDLERERAESVAVIRELIELLPPGRRRIIRLYFLVGLSVREIANLLNLTETTVRNQRNRALIFLKGTLR